MLLRLVGVMISYLFNLICNERRESSRHLGSKKKNLMFAFV